MSLWAEYHKETEGHECIETEFGFVRYQLLSPVCAIHDLFVAREHRLQGKGLEIMNEVVSRAQAAGCNLLWSRVGLGMLCANESLKANLNYGFKVQQAENGYIIMTKDIGGQHG